jgi:hypothetical protein
MPEELLKQKPVLKNRILDYVRSKPGMTEQQILAGLKMSPSGHFRDVFYLLIHAGELTRKPILTGSGHLALAYYVK